MTYFTPKSEREVVSGSTAVQTSVLVLQVGERGRVFGFLDGFCILLKAEDQTELE